MRLQLIEGGLKTKSRNVMAHRKVVLERCEQLNRDMQRRETRLNELKELKQQLIDSINEDGLIEPTQP